jgi:transcriptional regulator with XRE-family HTH domain
MWGMAHAHPRSQEPAALGQLLQYWRRARNLSQLALAREAYVSPRHLCFLETGRAKPSRDMVLLLADVLAVPLRERNALLLAAGFAPMFRESTLDERELAPVRTAIHAILKQPEPYPAVVMNRHWDILAINGAATRFFGMLLDGWTPQGASNILRLMFHPDGLRPFVDNWRRPEVPLLLGGHNPRHTSGHHASGTTRRVLLPTR